jgi:hypothetical protein
LRLVIAYQFLDLADFRTGESTTPLQANRLKPEFCDFIITLNVNVWRLIAISCIKEETVGTAPVIQLTSILSSLV